MITPLMRAAYKGDAERIRGLATRRNVNKYDRGSGFTALMFAAKEAHPGAVACLLELGADPHLNCPGGTETSAFFGETALSLAVGFPDGSGFSMCDVSPQREETVALLLRAGSPLGPLPEREELSPGDGGGVTPLTIAAHNKRHSLVRLLLSAGAAVDGPTVLHEALLAACRFLWRIESDEEHHHFESNILQTVQLLLEAGATANVRNASGETPLRLARGFSRVEELLLQNGADRW
jgi:ankyrin repeat protein